MPKIGRYRFSFDPWRKPEIEEEHLEESGDIGDPDVEGVDWKPINGRPSPDTSVVFVDGVRRTESLIYIEDETGSFREGAFVSVAAGALLMKQGRINPMQDSLQESLVKRFLLVRGDLKLETRHITFSLGAVTVDFELLPVEGEISPHVNKIMSDMELTVARRSFKRLKPDLIITDGTVHYSAAVKRFPFVGYIKKHRRMYIPSERTYILREIAVGQRTPLVLIHSQPTMDSRESSTLDKFTWYVRIGDEEGIGGIARLEISAGEKSAPQSASHKASGKLPQKKARQSGADKANHSERA